MIIVSDQQMEAFEAEHAAGFPRRFHEWWQTHIAPDKPAGTTERLVFAHRDEFQLVGVREEEDQFLFLYARALMPEMGDMAYLATMDAVFLRAPVSERIAAIADIARKGGQHR